MRGAEEGRSVPVEPCPKAASPPSVPAIYIFFFFPQPALKTCPVASKALALVGRYCARSSHSLLSEKLLWEWESLAPVRYGHILR